MDERVITNTKSREVSLVRLASLVRGYAPLFLLVAAWSCAAAALREGMLPGPLVTVKALAGSMLYDPLIAAQGGGEHGYAPHVWSTLWHVFVGSVVGIILGLGCTLTAVQGRWGRSAWTTVLELFRTVPPLILVPFVAVPLGTSHLTRIVTVGIYATLTTAVYTSSAVENLPAHYLQLSRLLGARRLRQIITVQLPGVLPGLLGPVRLIFAFGLGISIVVEYLGSPDGIGLIMKAVVAYSRVDLVMVGVLWTVALALCLDAATLLMFSFLLRWTERRQLLEWLGR